MYLVSVDLFGSTVFGVSLSQLDVSRYECTLKSETLSNFIRVIS